MTAIEYTNEIKEVMDTGLKKTILYHFVDHYDDCDDDEGEEYYGTTCYINDGDGGVLYLEVCCDGTIMNLSLHECSFLGDTYLSLTEIMLILEDLSKHIRDIKEGEI
jgi:hypothetical protein